MKSAKLNFINSLALVVVIFCFVYFFWISFVLTKNEVKDNGTLNQITIVMVTLITLVLNYYFGSSNSSKQQQQTIADLQKTATTTAVTVAAATTENKVDKAVKIGELKAALEKLDPDSEDAKKLLDELKELEKQQP